MVVHYAQKFLIPESKLTGLDLLLRPIINQLPFDLTIVVDKQEKTWAAPHPANKRLKIQIKRTDVLSTAILNRDPLVLVDAYIHGDLEFEGTVDDIIFLGELISERKKTHRWHHYSWLDQLKDSFDSWARTSGHLSLCHSQDKDKEAIAHHYDLGNEFFKLWLDERMVYSCAYFPEKSTSLREAQEAKFDLICRKLQLSPGETLLDIGCGWGAFLHWAAKHYGVKAQGITLSEQQKKFCDEWINGLELTDSISVNLLDYRDLPSGIRFDKIVSVGMIEHVGKNNYHNYFKKIEQHLKPNGLFLNHGITSQMHFDNLVFADRFINKYIFPNGELTPLSCILSAAEAEGWEIVDVDAWRPHYARTLECWATTLEAKWEKAVSMVGLPATKLWHLYLWGCRRGFEMNYLGVYQTLLRKTTDRKWNLPMRRQGWLN